MTMNITDDFTREDLMKVIQRDRFVKEQLAGRIASLMSENLDLVAIIREQQEDLQSLRQGAAVLNGDSPPQTAGVAS